MKEQFFYDPKSTETHPAYWDCECTEQYIHYESECICVSCGARKEDQPNSRVSEIYAMHYRMIDKSKDVPDYERKANAYYKRQ